MVNLYIWQLSCLDCSLYKKCLWSFSFACMLGLSAVFHWWDVQSNWSLAAASPPPPKVSTTHQPTTHPPPKSPPDKPAPHILSQLPKIHFLQSKNYDLSTLYVVHESDSVSNIWTQKISFQMNISERSFDIVTSHINEIGHFPFSMGRRTNCLSGKFGLTKSGSNSGCCWSAAQQYQRSPANPISSNMCIRKLSFQFLRSFKWQEGWNMNDKKRTYPLWPTKLPI